MVELYYISQTGSSNSTCSISTCIEVNEISSRTSSSDNTRKMYIVPQIRTYPG